MRQQRGGQANRPQQIGAHDGLGIGQIVLLRLQVFRPHDSRVVDQYVQRRKLLRELRRSARMFAASSTSSATTSFPDLRRGLLQGQPAPPRNDDLIAQRVELAASPRPIPEPPPVIRIVLPVIFILLILRD